MTTNDPNEVFYFGTEAFMDVANSVCLDHGAFNGRYDQKQNRAYSLVLAL